MEGRQARFGTDSDDSVKKVEVLNTHDCSKKKVHP